MVRAPRGRSFPRNSSSPRSARPHSPCPNSPPPRPPPRLPPEPQAARLEEVLPKPDVNPVENDLSRNALPYATALAGACPWLAPAANVLTPETGATKFRLVFVPHA